MKHLGISGGGTKIAGLFGAAEAIITQKNYHPDVISGISAGALLSLPLALGKLARIKELVLNLDFDTFFNVNPVNKKGNIRVFNAIKKIIGGKPYLGKQDNLAKLLREVVTQNEFADYQRDEALAVCIVGSVDFYTGRRFYMNLKEVAYDDFVNFVNASASIPIFTQGFEFSRPIRDFEDRQSSYSKILLYDGGVRDHSPTAKILASPVFDIRESCTLFSRPEALEDILAPEDFEPKNLLSILDRYVEITNAEVSKNDATLEKEVIRDKNIKDHGTIYLPRVMKSVYDVDNGRLQELYNRSQDAVETNWVP